MNEGGHESEGGSANGVLRERSNSYTNALVATPSPPLNTVPTDDRLSGADGGGEGDPLVEQNQNSRSSRSDVPHWVEAGQGARPSAHSIMSQGHADHNPYRRKSGKSGRVRRCSLVDATRTVRGLTFDGDDGEIVRRISGRSSIVERPTEPMPVDEATSGAEAMLAVPHQIDGGATLLLDDMPTVAEALDFSFADSKAEGGVVSFDPRLTDDASVLAFLKLHNTPPSVAIIVTGWPKKKEVHYQSGSGRNVTTATRGLPEWRKIIDLSHLVERYGFIQAPPSGEHHDELEETPSGHVSTEQTETAESRVHEYVEDCKQLWLKSLVMTKNIDWTEEDAWKRLKLLIVQDVLQLYYTVGYEGEVVVSFPVHKPFVTVAASNWVNRLTFGWSFRATMCTSLLGLCAFPYLIQLERSTIEVSSHFRIPIHDVEVWWLKSRHRSDLLKVANPRRRLQGSKAAPLSHVESLGAKWSPNFAKGQVESLNEWLALTVLWLCLVIVIIVVAVTLAYD